MFLTSLANGTGLDSKTIELLIRTASHRYKIFYVTKRDGKKREVEQPSREIKLLQRWCVSEVISRMPVHSAAMGYRRGVGLKAIAEIHGRSRFLKHLDFRRFFPSILKSDILELCAQSQSRLAPIIESEEDAQLFSELVCRRGRLVIGSPSSPSLSNAVMYDFDAALDGACRSRMVRYSRYADDLLFSCNTPDVLREVEALVMSAVRGGRCPRLMLNNAKTFDSSKKNRRVALGLVLTSDDRVSIGRGKKRTIRSLVFRACSGEDLGEEKIVKLNGTLAFVHSVEPQFVQSLRYRYTAEKLKKAGIRLPGKWERGVGAG